MCKKSGGVHPLLRTPGPLSPFAWHFMPQNRAWIWATVQWWPIVLWIHRAALRDSGEVLAFLESDSFLNGLRFFLFAGYSVALATCIWPLHMWGGKHMRSQTSLVDHSFCQATLDTSRSHTERMLNIRLHTVQGLPLWTINHTSKHLENTYQQAIFQTGEENQFLLIKAKILLIHSQIKKTSRPLHFSDTSFFFFKRSDFA